MIHSNWFVPVYRIIFFPSRLRLVQFSVVELVQLKIILDGWVGWLAVDAEGFKIKTSLTRSWIYQKLLMSLTKRLLKFQLPLKLRVCQCLNIQSDKRSLIFFLTINLLQPLPYLPWHIRFCGFHGGLGGHQRPRFKLLNE